jgi:hypothetical protein
VSAPNTTPGPWLITDSGTVYALDERGKNNRFSVLLNGGFSVGYLDRTSDAELLANAHLIAAAPELYEALEVMVTFAERVIALHKLTDTNGICAGSRAILARARGEQP